MHKQREQFKDSKSISITQKRGDNPIVSEKNLAILKKEISFPYFPGTNV